MPTRSAEAEAAGEPASNPEGAQFANLLDGRVQPLERQFSESVSAKATGFAETSVFGLSRPVNFETATPSTPDTRVVAVGHAPGERDAAPVLNASGSTTATLLASSAAAPRFPIETKAIAPTAAIETPDPFAPRSSAWPAQSQVPEAIESVERAGPPKTTKASSRANVIRVALHATEQGLRIVARVGRMSRTELMRLRQSIRTLLSAHGVTDADITIAALIEEDDANG